MDGIERAKMGKLDLVTNLSLLLSNSNTFGKQYVLFWTPMSQNIF